MLDSVRAGAQLDGSIWARAGAQLRTRLSWIPMVLPLGVLAFLFVTAVIRYTNGHATIDLMIFDNLIWKLANGSHHSTVLIQTLLEDHFSPGLYVFAPLYALVATPIWLLLAQAMAVGWAVWQICKRLQPYIPQWALGLLAAALISTGPVSYALLFDFHQLVLAIPLALAAAWAAQDERPIAAAVYGVLAASFRIEIGFAALVAVLVLPGSLRARRLTIGVMSAYLLVAFAADTALGVRDDWAVHYARLGSSPVDFLMHPWRAVSVVFSLSFLVKVWPWMLCGGFLFLARLRHSIPAAVAALPLVLSSWGGTELGVYHYGIGPALLLALAWVPVVKKYPLLVWAVIGSNLALTYAFSPLTPPVMALSQERQVTHYLSRDTRLPCLVAGIPPAAAVSATDQPGSLLAHREELYLYPFPFSSVARSTLPNPMLEDADERLAKRVDYVIAPVGSNTELLSAQGFRVEGRAGQFVRWHRGSYTSVDC